MIDDGCILVGRVDIKGHDQKKRVYSIEGLCPTPSGLGAGGNTEPKILISSDFKSIYQSKEDEKLTITKPFTYVSLFSGVGGFEQALNKLGGRCVMASEIDKWANLAYETLYGHKTVGDITKVRAEDVPDHDLLVGGFPCQAFSVAGKRLGFEDTRGTLFFEIARIAKVKRPKAMLLENVKGLVSHDKGKTLNTIIQTLCDIGYTVDFEVLNSKYFGVPQNRERVFIIAIRDDLITPEPWNVGKRTDVVAKGKRRISQIDGVKTFNFDWPPQTEVTTRLRDILEDNVDERYYLSEEKTTKLIAQLERQAPSVTEEIKCFNPRNVDTGEQTRMQDRVYDTNGTSIALTAGFSERMNVLEPQMLGHIDLKGHDAIKRVYSTEGVSPTLTTMGGGHREPKIAEPQIEQFTQGDGVACCIDANYTKGIGPSAIDKGKRTHVIQPIEYNRKTGIGKELDVAHTVNHSDWRGLNRNQTQNAVLEEIRPVLTPDRENKRQNGRRFKNDGEESFTLTAQDRHGVAIGTPPRYRIRKLTPRECFRLQGFPDSEFDKLVSAGISNSQLYKMAGNAVTVNVIEAIGERLIPLITEVDAE
jgi:DNA (cytosine-5)-methyltransferase 1